jgi:predicted PurR-regulated permease PerM
MFLVAAVSAAGLCLIRNPYALLLGILIGIVDAFPVLGSGSILVPWAVAELIGKDFFQAAVLLTIYVITMLAREVMETHLMGKEIGLKPLYVLMAVYVGMKLFGVGGIFLGPVGLTILKTVAET